MTHHTEAELLPCPFCGSEHVIMEQYKADGLRIICKNCAVKREQRTMRKSIDWLRAGMISDWNRRAPAAPVPQGFELVQEAFLREFCDKSKTYLLNTQAPAHYWNQEERDAYSDGYQKCGSEFAKLREYLAAAPQLPEKDNE